MPREGELFFPVVESPDQNWLVSPRNRYLQITLKGLGRLYLYGDLFTFICNNNGLDEEAVNLADSDMGEIGRGRRKEKLIIVI